MSWLKKIFESKMQPVSLNDNNFQSEVMSFSGPCLVDVWGPGCQPCAKLAPTIVDLANDYRGKVKVCELNAAEAPKSASRMGVRGTPTVIAYYRGRELTRVVGWKPKSYFDQLIEAEFGDLLDEPAPTAQEAAGEVVEETAAPAKNLNKKALRKSLKKGKK